MALRRGALRLNAAVERRPVVTAVAVTATKAVVADLMVQLLLERREAVDTRRSALFGTFGGAYQGMFQYWMYNKVFESLWPGRGLMPTVCKVLASNGVSDPLFFFPTFYTMREVVNTGSLSGDCARNGLYKYSQNYWKDWTNSWMIWLPGYTGAFVMPPHLRMPWIASVSFGYVCLLSFTRGDYKPTQPPNDG